ncbi:MAG: hypothetical protein WCS31_09775 [Verrucomicrobiae bacterium]
MDFYHYDFFAQALAKLERGHARDLADVGAMMDRELICSPRLLELFESIRPGLIRYPAIDIPGFAESVYEFCQPK